MIAPIGKTQYDPLWRAIPIGIPDEDENAGPSVAQPPATNRPESAPIGTVADAAPAPAVKAVPIGNPVLEAHQKRLGYLQRSGSGIDQITHPVDEEGNQTAQHVGLGKKVLSGLLHVGDAVGGAMFPTVMAGIPGTTLHHDMLIGQAERAVGNDLAEEKSQAQANEANARADALRNPPDKDPNLEKVIVSDAEGQPQFANHNTKTGQFFDQAGKLLNGAKPYEKEVAPKAPGLQYDNGIPVSVTDGKGNTYDVNDPNLPADLKPLVRSATRAHQQHVTEEDNRANKAAERQADTQARAFAHQEKMAESRQDQPTGTTRTMIESAPKVTALVDRVRALVNQQAQNLGPASSRWAEFMSGKVGAPNPEFTKLRTDVGLLTTLLMRMHVGARGGEYIMQHFQSLIDSSKQSPQNLLAALDEVEKYAHDVANEGEQHGMNIGGRENTGSTHKIGETKKFPNGKTGTWDGHGWVSQ